MPNGGTDCCMNCPHNRANDPITNPKSVNRNTRVPYCMVNDVVISNRAWTYCSNIYSQIADPNVPIFTNGISSEGYRRIPWFGLIEPLTDVVVDSCDVCRGGVASGIKLIESNDVRHHFCSNDHYVQWVSERGDDSPIVINKPPLHQSAATGDLQSVERQLSTGIDIDVSDEYGRAAIHLAAINGRAELVSHLINKGANLSIADRAGWTPLHYAAFFGQEACVVLLVNAGSDITGLTRQQMKPVELAGSEGYSSIVKLLVLKSYDTEEKRAQAIIEAASCGNLDIVEALVGAGVDIESKTEREWTPLITAVYNGHVTTAVFLLDHGANVNAQDRHGNTSLSITRTWRTSGMSELENVLLAWDAT